MTDTQRRLLEMCVANPHGRACIEGTRISATSVGICERAGWVQFWRVESGDRYVTITKAGRNALKEEKGERGD